MDHDQRFKTLIKQFFAEFLLLFFAPWAARLDAGAAEWLDTEVFPDPPEGHRHVLDLVAKLPTRQGVPGQREGAVESWLALVHIEIESPDKATLLRPRMCYSYLHLRQRHALPVLPIVLYLRVGLDGLGVDVYEENFWEFQPLHFQYLYVGLPALDAVEYVHGDNWLGVALAALMRIPHDRSAWLGAEALRRIQSAPLSEQQRFLLGECVQAYLPLDEGQQAEFERLVATEPYKGVQAMNTTWYEKGIEKGRAEGRQEGRGVERREILRELLEERFGPLTPSVQERIQQMAVEQLSPLIRAVARANSLRDLSLEQ
jgi:hypothetical protein